MKALIPAAGQGTRLRPHTNTKPKPMVSVAGKQIIGHMLDNLDGSVDEIIVIVGYMKEKLREFMDENYGERFRIIYVEQKRRLGLGHAVHEGIKFMKESGGMDELLITLGDEIFGMDYGEMVRIYSEKASLDGMIGVKNVDKPQHYGIVELDGNGVVSRLVEKPPEPASDLAIAGVYLIRNTALLHQCLEDIVKGHHMGAGGEYQLTDALQMMVQRGARFGTFQIDVWYDCGRPEMLLEVNRVLLEKHHRLAGVEGRIGCVLENSTLIQPSFVGEGGKIENSVIGPYASIEDGTEISDSIIRDCIIGSRSVISNMVMKDSIIGDEVVVKGRKNRLNLGENTSIEFE